MRRCAFACADQYKYFFSCSSIYNLLDSSKTYIVICQLLYHYLFRMTYCITSRRGTSKLLELVPNPFDDTNKICSKQKLLLQCERVHHFYHSGRTWCRLLTREYYWQFGLCKVIHLRQAWTNTDWMATASHAKSAEHMSPPTPHK